MVCPWLEARIRLKGEQTPKLRDGGPKPDWNSILYIPPAMTRRVDRGRPILGTELEGPKLVAQGGDGVCRKRDPRSAVEAQGNLARLAPGA